MTAQFFHLIVYIDNDPRAQFLNVELHDRDLPRLHQCLADMLPPSARQSDAGARPIESVHYWNPDDNAYEPLTSIALMGHCGNRAQLWVQTTAMRLEEVDRQSDKEEFAEVSAYVEAMRTEKMSFSLSSAFRVRLPKLEKFFQTKSQSLVDRHAPSVLLFYSANGNSGAEALESGFRLPADGSGLLFTTSMGDGTRPFTGTQKALLCEVAVGKVVPPAAVRTDGSGQRVRVFDSSVADAVVEWKGNARCYTVYDPNQAIPRYLVEIVSESGRSSGKPPQTPLTPSGLGDRQGMVRRTETLGYRSERQDSRPQSPLASSGTYRSGSPFNNSFSNPQHNAVGTGGSPNYYPTSNTGAAASTYRCPFHAEESLSLWCATCHMMVCSYCLSIGDHRGHDGRDLDYILGIQSLEVDQLISDFSDQHRLSTGKLDEINVQSKALSESVRQAEVKLNETFAELHAAVTNRHRELSETIQAGGTQRSGSDTPKGGSLFAAQSWRRLADLSRERLQELNSIRQRIQSSRSKNPEGSSNKSQRHGELQARRMEAVRTLPLLIKELKSTLARERCPTAVAAKVDHSNVALSPALDTKDCLDSIRRLGTNEPPPKTTPVQKQDSHHPQPTQQQTAMTRRASVNISPQMMSARNKLLEDLFSGYIWTVPNAAVHFGIDQKADLLSDVFLLSGYEWELKLVHADVEGAPHVHLFLRPHKHSYRADFRVTLFNNGKWHTREASDWSDAYKGKGWGIRPFCSKKELLAEFLRDGSVKFCIMITGELY